MQFLKAAHVDGAVIVTTPQEVSLLDVRKELNFASKVGRAAQPALAGGRLIVHTHTHTPCLPSCS